MIALFVFKSFSSDNYLDSGGWYGRKTGGIGTPLKAFRLTLKVGEPLVVWIIGVGWLILYWTDWLDIWGITVGFVWWVDVLLVCVLIDELCNILDPVWIPVSLLNVPGCWGWIRIGIWIDDEFGGVTDIIYRKIK